MSQTNKLVWIINTIAKAGKIPFEEINRKWVMNKDLSDGQDMLKRTFIKWKEKIFENFDLIIECEKVAPYRYYIENIEDLKSGSVKNWLISTYSVYNSISESKSIKDRILLEEIPSGREHLDSIIDAMKSDHLIHITYYNYWRGDSREHYLMPLCVKLFRQRWYMVGRSWPSGDDRTYCLDRIQEFRLSSHTFDYPDDFDPKAYFNDSFGIIVDKKINVEDVIVKVTSDQANYMRDLPLHKSQEEIERNDEYSMFKIHVRPTYDFIQELLWNREELEVVEPQWLRNEIAETIERMNKKYNVDDNVN